MHLKTRESKQQSGLDFDWQQIARTVLISRALDELEENRLAPEGKVLYQFSARGHELAQVLLGNALGGRRDAVSAYYRSRPLLLALGLPLEDAVAGPLMRAGSYSDGRDIGVVANLPRSEGPVVLPMGGDVGSQYTPAAGWAQSIRYYQRQLDDQDYSGCLAVAVGGDGSVATNGFWSALTIATTLRLPLLFFIEDNGFGLSVPSELQTPGGNIAANLASFQELRVVDADGTDPVETSAAIATTVETIRQGSGPALLRVTVPRLAGHSGQDTQTYKSAALMREEKERDPLDRLRRFLVPDFFSAAAWQECENEARQAVEEAAARALDRPQPDPSHPRRYLFAETMPSGGIEPSDQGGLHAAGHVFPPTRSTPQPDKPVRINMLTAIRQTLEHELAGNPRVLLFGEDVGAKGGVHAASMGLQRRFGEARVFDTSLSEEGIMGRAVGMALAGLMPVAEIQFRKYADPATEQLHNCGTIRWRTANRWAAPIVVRIPGGFAKSGDPWHSVCDEVSLVRSYGWQVAFPSNAEDATGLLRAALRSANPTIFFEHRALLDAASARRPYPGDHYLLPFGQAAVVQPGQDLTVICWGAMVERCQSAARQLGRTVEIIDLRTLAPWDEDTVLSSVSRNRRCLIVHEDTLTAGFGAEVAARLADETFFELDAPVRRLAVSDGPLPHNPGLMEAVLPSVEQIAETMETLLAL